MSMNERCSFCGASSTAGARLVQGGGPDCGGLPIVQICEDCVKSCDEAFRTERRIGQARASEAPPRRSSAPPPDAEERSPLGRISEWTTFEMDGLELEWRAERTLATSRIPLVLLTIRRQGEQGGVLIELEGHAAPDYAQVMEAASWLDAEKRPKLELAVWDWTPFERADEKLEWRAARVLGVRARPAVWVHVRNAKTGVGTMMDFEGDMQPTVEDAVMVASEAEELLRQSG
jgi:hypothetical protein